MQETPQQYTRRILGYVEGKDALRVQRGTAGELKKLVKGLSKKQLAWRPNRESWSISQILAHLADAEVVLSWRMRSILGSNGTEIQAFNQDAWADTFQYAKSDPKWSIEVFSLLRENNLRMLKALSKEKWDYYGMHSERGKESIAHIAKMMAGHDTNHLKQVAALRKGAKSR